MNDSWIKETTELIDELQKKHDQIESDLDALLQERDEIEQQIGAADSLIRLYRTKHKVLPVSLQGIYIGYFGDKTYPEILTDIATKSNNYLKMSDAVEIMLQAGVNNKKQAIQSNSYAAISRLVKAGHFIKIKKGEYRYTNGLQKPTQKTATISDQKQVRSHSGVQKAIKDLKDSNPMMTKKEVLKWLVETGFDFKGKKPSNAVNIVWAKLGYSKEGKQLLSDLLLKDRDNETSIVEVKTLPS